MPVIAASGSGFRSLATRRNAVFAAIFALAAALFIVAVRDPQLSRKFDDGVQAGLKGAKTVAAMLTERSPGERTEGALASLKHRRIALHERALPKIRHIIPPVAGLVGMPVVPAIIPPPVAAPPLYNVVAGGPPIELPPVLGTPGGPGGPPFLSIPPPGGGGGIFVPPPIITTAVPPPPPVTAAVPEPGSWAMMLAGFTMIGGTLRRKKRGGRQPIAA